MHKTLEKIQDAVEEAIRPIIAKGSSMTAAELDVLTKAVCTIEKINQIENDRADYSNGQSFDDEGNSYRRGRSATTGRYVSRDAMPMSRAEGYSSRRFYDGDASRSGGYSGHSIKDRMVSQLEKMYDEAQTDHERQVVNTWIRRIQVE